MWPCPWAGDVQDDHLEAAARMGISLRRRSHPRDRSCNLAPGEAWGSLGRSSLAITGAVVGTTARAAPSPAALHGMKAGIVSPPAPEPEVCKQ